MKKYTTLEVIKELKNSTDNNLRFDGKGCNGEDVYAKKIDRKGQQCIVLCYDKENEIKPLELNTFVLNMEWMVSDREVDVLTAMKEHYDGKDIYCIIGDERINYKREIGCQLQEDDGTAIGSLEIINGKWFIKGGSK